MDSTAGRKNPVDIQVIATDSQLVFKHNGPPFSPKALLALVFKHSHGKEGSETTGRFGTGFMTTHCLSTLVHLKSSLMIESDVEKSTEVKGFRLDLDHTGSTEEELRECIEKTIASCEMCECDEWTEFIYDLALPTNKEAKDLGIASFIDNIAKVLLFCPRLNSIKLQADHTVLEVARGETRREDAFQIKTLMIKRSMDAKPEAVSFLMSENQWEHDGAPLKVDIALRVSEDRKICGNEGSTCLYCTYPLVGSEEHQLPFLFNCPQFEPDTERKSLLLNGDDDDQAKLVLQKRNKVILKKSVEFFRDLVTHLVSYNYTNLKELTNGILKVPSIDNMNDEWYLEEYKSISSRFVKFFSMPRLSTGALACLFV